MRRIVVSLRMLVVTVMAVATGPAAYADGFDVSIPFERDGAGVPMLPRTGASILLLVAVSVVLIALGAAVVAAARSRMRALSVRGAEDHEASIS